MIERVLKSSLPLPLNRVEQYHISPVDDIKGAGFVGHKELVSAHLNVSNKSKSCFIWSVSARHTATTTMNSRTTIQCKRSIIIMFTRNEMQLPILDITNQKRLFLWSITDFGSCHWFKLTESVPRQPPIFETFPLRLENEAIFGNFLP